MEQVTEAFCTLCETYQPEHIWLPVVGGEVHVCGSCWLHVSIAVAGEAAK